MQAAIGRDRLRDEKHGEAVVVLGYRKRGTPLHVRNRVDTECRSQTLVCVQKVSLNLKIARYFGAKIKYTHTQFNGLFAPLNFFIFRRFTLCLPFANETLQIKAVAELKF